MEYEYHVTGRVFSNALEGFPREFPFDGFAFNLSIMQCGESRKVVMVSLPRVEDRSKVSVETVSALCRELSKNFDCKVFVCCGREDYGNANVFNGGSDYEVVNEEWFLCMFEKGEKVLEERTNHWNEKIVELENC